MCTHYETRPFVCKQYQCKLLANLMKGQISFEEALEFVRKAVRLCTDVREKLNVQADQQLGRVINEFMKQSSDEVDGLEFRRKNAELFLEIISLNLFLKRNFRKHSRDDRDALTDTMQLSPERDPF